MAAAKKRKRFRLGRFIRPAVITGLVSGTTAAVVSTIIAVRK